MNLEKLGLWMSVFANLGVFAGFLVVAYQLHQTTIGLQSSSLSATNQLIASSDTSMMGDTTYVAFAHSLTDPASLSPPELAQMWAYMSVTMVAASVAFDDYRQGIISENRWLAIRETFVSYINHPVGRVMWETQAKGFDGFDNPTNRAFFDSIQERLDSVPPNATQHWFRAMLEEIRALPVETTPIATRASPTDSGSSAP